MVMKQELTDWLVQVALGEQGRAPAQCLNAEPVKDSGTEVSDAFRIHDVSGSDT
jgi:hypothetical protein